VNKIRKKWYPCYSCWRQ